MASKLWRLERPALYFIGLFILLTLYHLTGLSRTHFQGWIIFQQGFLALCIAYRIRHSNEPYLWLAVLFTLNFMTAFWLLNTLEYTLGAPTQTALVLSVAGVMVSLTLGHATIGYTTFRQLAISITPILTLIVGYSAIRLLLQDNDKFQHSSTITFNLILIAIIAFSMDRWFTLRRVNVVVILLQGATIILGIASILGIFPMANYSDLSHTLMMTNPPITLAIDSIAGVFILFAVFHKDNYAIDDYLERSPGSDHMGLSSYLNYLFLSIWLILVGSGYGPIENRIVAASGLLSAFIVLWQFRIYRSNLLETNVKLNDLANTDALTNVLNRQGLERTWAELPVMEVIVLFVDLDKFKPINDTHGHNIGDKVLQTIGSRLLESVRDSDMVCRWGGDEFVIVCPDLDSERAVRMSRRLTARISDPMHIEAGPTITMEATIGSAQVTTGGDLADSLQAADTDMYKKKRSRDIKAMAQSAQ